MMLDSIGYALISNCTPDVIKLPAEAAVGKLEILEESRTDVSVFKLKTLPTSNQIAHF